jgi:hypothetical protein
MKAALAAPTFQNFANGYLKVSGATPVSVGGVTLQVTRTGDVQVVIPGVKVLWRSASSANCSVVANCKLLLQGDGNLVLFAGGSPVWSSATYDHIGAFLTLSSVAPYLTIRNSNFAVVWPVAGAAGPAALTSAARTGATATAVQTFLGSLAVNAHAGQDGKSTATLMKMLNYLGVFTVRDSLTSNSKATLSEMAKVGVKFDGVAGDPYAADALTNFVALADAKAGALLAIEGPNEINNFPFKNNGVTSVPGWPNANGPLAQSDMTKLFSIVNANAKLASTSVYDLTWGGTTSAELYGFFSLANRADYGNIHFYPTVQPYDQMRAAFAGNYYSVLPNQGVITETGYDSALVSEKAQAIMNLNLYLGAFQQGFRTTYLYELYDEWQTYGLFKKDLTPKPTANAIHNLTSILKDSGTALPAPGALNYKITGLPATGHSLLLQKSDKTFELIVWNEPPVSKNGVDLVVTPVPVTVQLGATYAKVWVYNPFLGTGPLKQLAAASTVTFNLGAQALIIEIK